VSRGLLCTTCPALCHPLSLVPTLSPLPRGTGKDKHTCSFFFFLVQWRGTEPAALSCCPRRTPSPLVNGGGSKGDTLIPHLSLLYRAQDSSWHVAHQLPPVDGETSLRLLHHSHPHTDSLGTTRSPDLKGGDLCPYGRTQVVVRRGPRIAFHTGRRVRDRIWAPIGLKNKWDWTELNCQLSKTPPFPPPRWSLLLVLPCRNPTNCYSTWLHPP